MVKPHTMNFVSILWTYIGFHEFYLLCYNLSFWEIITYIYWSYSSLAKWGMQTRWLRLFHLTSTILPFSKLPFLQRAWIARKELHLLEVTFPPLSNSSGLSRDPKSTFCHLCKGKTKPPCHLDCKFIGSWQIEYALYYKLEIPKTSIPFSSLHFYINWTVPEAF